MNVEVVRDTHTIVRVDGEIDLSNAAVFEKGLNEAADEAPQGFIVDMADVAYIDSAGVQALLRVYSTMRESDGRLAVAVGNARIKLCSPGS